MRRRGFESPLRYFNFKNYFLCKDMIFKKTEQFWEKWPTSENSNISDVLNPRIAWADPPKVCPFCFYIGKSNQSEQFWYTYKVCAKFFFIQNTTKRLRHKRAKPTYTFLLFRFLLVLEPLFSDTLSDKKMRGKTLKPYNHENDERRNQETL